MKVYLILWADQDGLDLTVRAFSSSELRLRAWAEWGTDAHLCGFYFADITVDGPEMEGFLPPRRRQAKESLK
jgi:hypothetical protein